MVRIAPRHRAWRDEGDDTAGFFRANCGRRARPAIWKLLEREGTGEVERHCHRLSPAAAGLRVPDAAAPIRPGVRNQRTSATNPGKGPPAAAANTNPPAGARKEARQRQLLENSGGRGS